MKRLFACFKEAVFSLRFGRWLRRFSVLLAAFAFFAVTLYASYSMFRRIQAESAASQPSHVLVDSFIGGLEDSLGNDPLGKYKLVEAADALSRIKDAEFTASALQPLLLSGRKAPDSVLDGYPRDSSMQKNLSIPVSDAYGSPQDLYDSVNCAYVTANTPKYNDLKFLSGGFFDGGYEAAGAETPIILGFAYSPYYKVGDRLLIYDVSGKRAATVVGILDSDTYLKSRASLQNLNSYCLLPLYNVTKADIDGGTPHGERYIYMKMNGELYTERTEDDIQIEINRIFSKIGLQPLQVGSSAYAVTPKLGTSLAEISNAVLAAGIVGAVLAAAAALFSVIYGVKKDMSYYAALLVSGFSYRELASIVTLRYIISLSAAYALSVGLSAAGSYFLGFPFSIWPSAVMAAALCAAQLIFGLVFIRSASLAAYLQGNA